MRNLPDSYKAFGGLTPRRRIGYSGYVEDPLGRFTDFEPIPELDPPWGLQVFKKMRLNEPVVFGLVLQFESILLRAGLRFEGKNSEVFERSIKGGLQSIVKDCCSAFTYGFYLGEMVWSYKNGLLRSFDLEPRAQVSIQGISEAGVTQLGVEKKIPREKCFLWTPVSETRNPFGISILRGAYKPYYYKKSVEASEAVGIDRDISGIPVMTSPEGFDFMAADESSPLFSQEVKDTLDWAVEVVTKVRKDQQQGIVKPFGWTLELLQSKRGSTIDTSRVIMRYNTEMLTSTLQAFSAMGIYTGNTGTNVEVQYEGFLETCNRYVVSLASALESQLVPRLGRLLGERDLPKITFKSTSRTVLKDLASYIARLVSQGVVSPTLTLEKALLEKADMPLGQDKKAVEEG